jgi:hypothetical protein
MLHSFMSLAPSTPVNPRLATSGASVPLDPQLSISRCPSSNSFASYSLRTLSSLLHQECSPTHLKSERSALFPKTPGCMGFLAALFTHLPFLGSALFPVVHPISLQPLTKCSSRNSFALTTIHFHWGEGGSTSLSNHANLGSLCASVSGWLISPTTAGSPLKPMCLRAHPLL